MRESPGPRSVLGGALAQRSAGVVKRGKHPQNERPRQSRRRSAQAHSKDLRIEAAAERRRWLDKVEARTLKLCPEIVQEARREISCGVADRGAQSSPMAHVPSRDSRMRLVPGPPAPWGPSRSECAAGPCRTCTRWPRWVQRSQRGRIPRVCLEPVHLGSAPLSLVEGVVGIDLDEERARVPSSGAGPRSPCECTGHRCREIGSGSTSAQSRIGSPSRVTAAVTRS